MTDQEVYEFRGLSRVAVRAVLAYKVLRHGSRPFRLTGSSWPVVVVVLRCGDAHVTVNTQLNPPRKTYTDDPVEQGHRDLILAADSLCSLIYHRERNGLSEQTLRELDGLITRLRQVTDARP